MQSSYQIAILLEIIRVYFPHGPQLDMQGILVTVKGYRSLNSTIRATQEMCLVFEVTAV